MKIERLLEIAVIASSMLLLAKLSSCQDIIFPDDEEALGHVSAAVAPVTKPPKAKQDCPESMFLWPDPGPRSSWVCECKPRFAYFPANDSCHEIYTRGPCPPLHYVYLAANETQPICAANPCKRDNYVRHRGMCHPLRAKGGPCAVDAVLSVNETTNQLECVEADLIPFVIIDAPRRKDANCPKGSRRSSLGVCKLVL